MNLVIALLWLPLAAACLHILEEFAWPGGFPSWYRSYRGNAETVNRRFLILINAAMLLALLVAALAGRTERSVALILTLSAILFSNGCWHLWATYKSHSYSPGTVTGALLYVPLGLFEYISWIHLRQASLGTAGFAMLIGSLYPVWSAFHHSKQAAL